VIRVIDDKVKIEVEALKESELNFIQTMAESIIDSVATIKAGLETVKGYLLRVNEDNNVEIVKEVSVRIGKKQTT
jgi:hypothetical protein